MRLETQTIWIVGASEGLGRALAEALAAKGARLILSARRAERLETLAQSLPNARAVTMDVTDGASVSAAWRRVGDADHIVYCAGAYTPMPAQDWNHDAVLQMAEVNFTGALRVLAHVVPAFSRRNAGEITLIGSLSGFRGLPKAVGYSASKAALMHLGENLRLDLGRTNVKVRIANPGFIRTRLTAQNTFAMPQIMEPQAAAAAVVRAMESGRFSTSFPRPFAWVFRLFGILPNWLFFRILG